VLALPAGIATGHAAGASSVVAKIRSSMRRIAAPAEVPVGVITAMVGAPFFLLVMRSSRVREL
jgi:ABC-type Fe3+-siderophore transport system permease subunit